MTHGTVTQRSWVKWPRLKSLEREKRRLTVESLFLLANVASLTPQPQTFYDSLQLWIWQWPGGRFGQGWLGEEGLGRQSRGVSPQPVTPWGCSRGPGPVPTTGALSGTCSAQVRSRWCVWGDGNCFSPQAETRGQCLQSKKSHQPVPTSLFGLSTASSQPERGDLLCHSRFPQTAHKIWEVFFFFFKESRYKNKRNPYTLKIYWKLPPQMRYHLSRPPTPKLQTSKYICF